LAGRYCSRVNSATLLQGLKSASIGDFSSPNELQKLTNKRPNTRESDKVILSPTDAPIDARLWRQALSASKPFWRQPWQSNPVAQ
jgi:hypothetical protein